MIFRSCFTDELLVDLRATCKATIFTSLVMWAAQASCTVAQGQDVDSQLVPDSNSAGEQVNAAVQTATIGGSQSDGLQIEEVYVT